jgi:uncharacterized membrane protein (DUF485 family)
MFCAECRAIVNSTDRVCSACGAKVEQNEPATLPAYRNIGFGVLSVTRMVLRALSEGKVIRNSIAVVLQVAAVLVLLAGLLGLIQILKLSFQSPAATATIGGLVVALLLMVGIFSVSQIYLFRAQSIRELEDSPFTVIPILSILFRTMGETYAVVALAAGVGGCLFTWLSGTSPRALLSGFGGFMPSMPAGGESFLDGLIFFASLAAAAFASLVVFYALAELVGVLVDIAINVRRLGKRDALLS